MKEFKNVCMFFSADEDLSMDAFNESSDSPFGESDTENTDSPFDQENKEKPADVVEPDVIFDEVNPQGNLGY